MAIHMCHMEEVVGDWRVVIQYIVVAVTGDQNWKPEFTVGLTYIIVDHN
jgi:hypothetical protein